MWYGDPGIRDGLDIVTLMRRGPATLSCSAPGTATKQKPGNERNFFFAVNMKYHVVLCTLCILLGFKWEETLLQT